MRMRCGAGRGWRGLQGGVLVVARVVKGVRGCWVVQEQRARKTAVEPRRRRKRRRRNRLRGVTGPVSYSSLHRARVNRADVDEGRD